MKENAKSYIGLWKRPTGMTTVGSMWAWINLGLQKAH